MLSRPEFTPAGGARHARKQPDKFEALAARLTGQPKAMVTIARGSSGRRAFLKYIARSARIPVASLGRRRNPITRRCGWRDLQPGVSQSAKP
jgi:hypothetical protein